MVDVKYPVLKPKESISDKLAMSKIHISRNWKLPPLRSRAPGDKLAQYRKRSATLDTNSDVSSPEGDYVEGPSQSKKKKQNREAQRAYRERSKNRLQALEENVETLQAMVRSWQNKYKKLAQQYDDLKTESSKKIKDLEREVQENKDDKKCFICMKNADIDDIKRNAKETDLKPIFTDDFLNQAIKNFKPIPAVSIKSANNTSPPINTVKLNKKLPNLIPQSLSTTPVPSQSPEEGSLSPQPFSNTTLGENTLDVEKEDCGFCNDNTTCLCHDLNESKNQHSTASRSSVLLLDTLPQHSLVEAGKTKYTESAIRSTNCTENPSKCQKCTDIDASCIKPVQDNLVSNTPHKRSYDIMDDLPMEFEIDLNKFLPPTRKKKSK
ncbi:AP-1-like transcription factor YAP5 [Nakaseomyces bracarensis]|uniref:AP-1-like transcription factor YAP5 n=1 Tax=Nakaseomyces bracarensis TaxID=273131 RepID=A0ABR4NVC8_9SACH